MSEFTSSIRSEVGFDPPELLVSRLQEGDGHAFSEVFRLYKNLVYTLSLKLLADKSEAMDVTQEVFLTLFRKIHKFRGECSLKTWLYRVTLNQTANRNRWWRRRYRDRICTLGLGGKGEGGTPDPASGQPLPDRSLFAHEIRSALQQGLEELPFSQKAAVVLRDVRGLSYEEIAEVTGVRSGTVKSRIARGRERLRKILREYQPGEMG
ncbi:MAG: RNA polymerase sigma factor [Acidobacteriota bacterium]